MAERIEMPEFLPFQLSPLSYFLHHRHPIQPAIIFDHPHRSVASHTRRDGPNVVRLVPAHLQGQQAFVYTVGDDAAEARRTALHDRYNLRFQGGR